MRREAKQFMSLLSPQERSCRSALLEERLLHLLIQTNSATPLSVIGLFVPLLDEPCWNPPRWEEMNIKLVYPALIEGRQAYRFPEKPWPLEGPWAGKGDEVVPDLIVVPGLGFKPDGWRLGRGGGWYDRYLEHHRPRLGCWGVCFEDLVRETGWEPGTHDRKMDLIVTDVCVRHCPQASRSN